MYYTIEISDDILDLRLMNQVTVKHINSIYLTILPCFQYDPEYLLQMENLEVYIYAKKRWTDMIKNNLDTYCCAVKSCNYDHWILILTLSFHYKLVLDTQLQAVLRNRRDLTNFPFITYCTFLSYVNMHYVFACILAAVITFIYDI